MKLDQIIARVAVLFSCSMAFAVNGSQFYNVIKLNTGVDSVSLAPTYALYLTQDDVACTSDTWSMNYTATVTSVTGNSTQESTCRHGSAVGTLASATGVVCSYTSTMGFSTVAISGECVASLADTPENLKTLLQNQWVASSDSAALHLGSDIDLGEFSATDGSCAVNHIPLPFRTGSYLDGGNHTIKNLCYVSDTTAEPIGLFGRVDSSSVMDLTIQNVNISITGGSNDGAAYYPVGALTGVVVSSWIPGVTLKDVSIEAPFAGGLAGLLVNSTMDTITAVDNISVTNSQAIATNYAGYNTMVKDYVYLNSYMSADSYKVFLGGLVGASFRTNEDATIVAGNVPLLLANAKVAATIRNNATGFNSTLGGVVGMLSAGAGTFTDANNVVTCVVAETMNNVSLDKRSSGFATTISGGSTMGGIVGYHTLYQGRQGSIKIMNSKFVGSIGASNSLDVIAIGGILGRSLYTPPMSVVFDSDTANVDITDDVSAAGNYTYYAGGIMGFGNDCGYGGNGKTDFVSIVNSITSGNMNISASGAINGMHMNAYLGGFAGMVNLALDTNGLSNDSTSMNIVSNIKTAFDESKYSFDNLSVGGFIGHANVGNVGDAQLTNLKFGGKITVNDSLMNVSAGGIVGSFTDFQGGKSISFNNVEANNALTTNLISYESVVSAKPVTNIAKTVKLGGLCGFCNAILNVEAVGLNGRIVAKTGFAGDTLMVGGLVGGSYNNTNSSLDLKNSFMNGKIDVGATATTSLAGYLYGWVKMDASEYSIMSSYHYGEDSFGPFGRLEVAGNEVSSWENSEKISYVVRNGTAESLSSQNNGTQVEDDMMIVDFAGFMNEPYGTDSYVWNFRENTNNNLPFVVAAGDGIAPGEQQSRFKVVFLCEGTQVGATHWVKEGGSVVPPTPAVIEGKTFVEWSDSSFTKVTSDLTIDAKYEVSKYTIIFRDIDGVNTDTTIEYTYGSKVTYVKEREATEAYTYTFKYWLDAYYSVYILDEVKENLVVKPVYDSVKVLYSVAFVDDLDKTLIGDTVKVGYGEAAVPTATPAEHEGYVFDGWNKDVSKVVENMTIYANYTKVESSSSESSSSKESEKAESSSSAGALVEFTPSVKQTGDAVEFVIKALNLDAENATQVVLSYSTDDGVNETVTLDFGKVASIDTVWNLVPAPAGNYSWNMELENGDNSATSESGEFKVNPVITVKSQSWRMVALNAVKDGAADLNKSGSIYWWDEENPVGDYWQYQAYDGSSMENTRGFWYGSSAGATLSANMTDGSVNSEITWTLENKYSGWNLVANPYGWAVKLPEYTGKAKVDVWSMGDNGYEPSPACLEPYEAVWVKTDKNTSWTFSGAPYFEDCGAASSEKSASLKKALAKSTSDGWSVVMSLTDNFGKQDSWNVIGAGASAETMEEPPSAMGDNIRLAVSENGSALAKSVKASADEYEWTLVASATSYREGAIAFDGLEELQNAGLHLYATVDGVTTEVNPGETLSLTLTPAGKKVSVRVASAPEVASATVVSKVQNLRMVRSEGLVQMQFDVSSDLAGAASSYTLVGVNGKKIASGKFTATAGTNGLAVSAPKSGMYLMQVKVGSQVNAAKVLVK